MISKKIKDIKYRTLFAKNEKKKLINKFLFVYLLNKFNQKSIENKQQKYLVYYLLLKKKLFSKLKYRTRTKVVRRCHISNRNRGTFRPYNMSRFFLRQFIQYGVLPGYTKAVW